MSSPPPPSSGDGPSGLSQSAPSLSQISSASSPQSNDSAPPPSSNLAAPPPPPPPQPSWTMAQPSIVRPPVLPPAYAPNSSVPRFIHALAVIVFVVGGTTTALATWFYKSIVYPRLVKALLARTQLTTKSQLLYSQLVEQHVTALYKGKGGALLRSGTVTVEGATAPPGSSSSSDTAHEDDVAPALSASNDSIADEKAKLLASDTPSPPSAAAAAAADTASEEPAVALPPPAPVLAPITRALAALSAELPAPGTASSLPAELPKSSSLEWDSSDSQQASLTAAATSSSLDLLKSLHKLNEYLDTESYAVVSSSSYRYNAGGPASSTSSSSSNTAGKERRALLEAVQRFKSEIRGVKGALLNRRNFAALAPRSTAGASAGVSSATDLGLVQG